MGLLKEFAPKIREAREGGMKDDDIINSIIESNPNSDVARKLSSGIKKYSSSEILDTGLSNSRNVIQKGASSFFQSLAEGNNEARENIFSDTPVLSQLNSLGRGVDKGVTSLALGAADLTGIITDEDAAVAREQMQSQGFFEGAGKFATELGASSAIGGGIGAVGRGVLGAGARASGIAGKTAGGSSASGLIAREAATGAATETLLSGSTENAGTAALLGGGSAGALGLAGKAISGVGSAAISRPVIDAIKTLRKNGKEGMDVMLGNKAIDASDIATDMGAKTASMLGKQTKNLKKTVDDVLARTPEITPDERDQLVVELANRFGADVVAGDLGKTLDNIYRRGVQNLLLPGTEKSFEKALNNVIKSATSKKVGDINGTKRAVFEMTKILSKTMRDANVPVELKGNVEKLMSSLRAILPKEIIEAQSAWSKGVEELELVLRTLVGKGALQFEKSGLAGARAAGKTVDTSIDALDESDQALAIVSKELSDLRNAVETGDFDFFDASKAERITTQMGRVKRLGADLFQASHNGNNRLLDETIESFTKLVDPSNASNFRNRLEMLRASELMQDSNSYFSPTGAIQGVAKAGAKLAAKSAHDMEQYIGAAKASGIGDMFKTMSDKLEKMAPEEAQAFIVALNVYASKISSESQGLVPQLSRAFTMGVLD